MADDTVKALEETNFIEIKRDVTTTEWTTSGKPVNISHIQLQEADISAESLSPTPPLLLETDENNLTNQVILLSICNL